MLHENGAYVRDFRDARLALVLPASRVATGSRGFENAKCASSRFGGGAF
jgi:hypothetical protein